MQEEGGFDGADPLSVALVAAYEQEKSLVLSIPAASRTLQEIGEWVHARRKMHRSGTPAEDLLHDKVCYMIHPTPVILSPSICVPYSCLKSLLEFDREKPAAPARCISHERRVMGLK